MDTPTPAPKFRYLAVGTLGEPKFLSALTDVPESDVKHIRVQGLGLRIQPLDKVQQDSVRDDLKAGWNDRGTPFYGATTFVDAEGEQVEASMVELTEDQWEKAKPIFELWNYHKKENGNEAGWFQFREVSVEIDGEVVNCIAEVLPDGAYVERVPENYQEDPAYQEFIDKMEQGIHAFRASIEGTPPGKEK